jgi:beta-xylosidase
MKDNREKSITFRITCVITLCMVLAGIFFVRIVQAEDTYTNPVLVETYTIKRMNPARYIGTLGIGDPSVLFHRGIYYLYPTGDNFSYDVYISPDLVHWEKGPKVFRSHENGVWAPDVFYNPQDRKLYLYYTVNKRIGVAVSDRPDGVFKDRGTLINNAIDAHMFQDVDGTYYLYFVTYPGFDIYVQPMETPLKMKGEPVHIIQPSASWEKNHVPITEAPWMLKHKGTYYLLYSGGSADSQDYAIGYATAKSPIGPFTKHPGNPIIKKGDGIFGPGHVSVTKDLNGTFWMVYHQQKDASPGWNRIICIDRLWFDDKGVLHAKVTRGTPQPAPATKTVKSK